MAKRQTYERDPNRHYCLRFPTTTNKFDFCALSLTLQFAILLFCANNACASETAIKRSPIDETHIDETNASKHQPLKLAELQADNAVDQLLRPAINSQAAAPIKLDSANSSTNVQSGSGKSSSRNEQNPSLENPGILPLPASSQSGKVLRLSVAFNESFLSNPRTGAIRAQLGITKAVYYEATVMPNASLIRDQGYIAEASRRFGSEHTYEPPWKIVFRMLAAKEQFKGGKLEVLNNLWQFRNDVRRAYTEVVTNQESYQTLSDLAELTKQLLEVTQKRVSAGAVAALDELKARLALSQAEIERTRGYMLIQKSKQHLNVMLARPVAQAVDIPRLPLFKLKAERSDMLPDFSVPVPPLSSYIEQAMENRLELRIAKQQIKVSEAQLRTAYGNIIPSPTFAAGQSQAGNPPSGPKLSAFFVAVKVEMPTFNLNQGDIVRLKATINQWKLQYQSNRNQVTDEVTNAYNDLIIARERIRQYQEHTLAESEEVARLARRSYEVGQSDIASALLALQANVITRSQYIEAVTDYAQAVTNLEKAVGEPLQ